MILSRDSVSVLLGGPAYSALIVSTHTHMHTHLHDRSNSQLPIVRSFPLNHPHHYVLSRTLLALSSDDTVHYKSKQETHQEMR